MLFRGFAFVLALPVAVLPHRLWARLPWWLPVRSAAFIAGILTLLAGMAVGIPGFLAHAGVNVSIANQGVLDAAMRDPRVGYERGAVAGAVSLSIFTFLLLTPEGWLTMYLVGTGGVRAAAAWFDDPVERTIAGRLRTLYPLAEHTDLEAVRKSVQYDMPDARPRD